MILDDIMGPFLRTVCPKSATGREMQWRAQMARTSLANVATKSLTAQQWAAAITGETLKAPRFSISQDFAQRPREHKLMKAALIATSPDQLKRWKQMSPTRRDAFIARVVRQGQSGYHSHMRGIYAAYTAEQVFHALKD